MGLYMLKTTFAVNWEYGVATHSGWFRMTNEDKSLLRIGSTHRGKPYAVAVIADGMGGSGDGALASEIALEAVKSWLDEQVPALLKQNNAWSKLAPSADRLFRDINTQLLEHAKYTGNQLGTTLTLLFLCDEMYFLCHIGDCRVYMVNRKQRLRQLSQDQSWAAEQIRKGRLSRLQVRKHPKRNVLLQSLGANRGLKLVKRFGFYSPETLFLLCSDGFYDRLSDRGIERIFREEDEQHDLQQLSDMLVNKALDTQSGDNISVVLLRSIIAAFSPWGRLFHRCKNFYMLFPADWRK
jgi:serine/threonine protein phosphatase PrpC